MSLAIFVNADQVKGATDRIQTHNQNLWRSAAVEQGASDEEIRSTEERMRAMDKPSTVGEQLNWLKEVGFVDVDCHYKNGQFAVFGGMKP